MTAERYNKISAPFRKNAKLKKALILYNQIATLLIAAAYLFAAAYLAVRLDGRVLPVTVPPAVGFALVSLLRILVNRQRPYEVLGIEPLLEKKTKGKSMPSRHLFSAFSIAVVFFYLCPAAGIAGAVLGVLLGLCRVILGVHFPSDVLVGALVGLVFTALGVYLPPWDRLW